MRRWHDHLDPCLKREPFSKQEDLSVIQAVTRLGQGRWAEIAKLLPGR